jgi:hypothetical protein
MLMQFSVREEFSASTAMTYRDMVAQVNGFRGWGRFSTIAQTARSRMSSGLETAL